MPCVVDDCQQEPNNGTNLCSLHANTLPPNSKIWSKVTVDQNFGRTPQTGRTEVRLTTFLQDASKVESTGAPALGDKLNDWVPLMCTYLTERGHWDRANETNPGDQGTPGGCEVGTTSLDFQGVRPSQTGDVYWIDLQGQIGGGGSKRKTYCQVKIQTRLANVPRLNRVRAFTDHRRAPGRYGSARQRTTIATPAPTWCPDVAARHARSGAVTMMRSGNPGTPPR